jgi:undecaprenyl-diphosphatase
MDQKLLFLINRDWTTSLLDRLMAVMSSGAFWGVPLGIIAVCAAIWGGFQGRVFVVVALLSFAMTDGVIGRILKRSVARARPHETQAGVRVLDLASPAWQGVFSPLKEKLSKEPTGKKTGSSFPSNHASNTAAVAMVAAMLWRRRGWLAFLPALCVAYSRVYVGSHWPTDALAGVCIGIGTALLMLSLAEWVWRRWGKNLAPRVAAQHPSLLTASPA